jgi:hypothetical protein
MIAAQLDHTAELGEFVSGAGRSCDATVRWKAADTTFANGLRGACSVWSDGDDAWSKDAAWLPQQKGSDACGGYGVRPNQYVANCGACSGSLEPTIAAMRGDAENLRRMASVVECVSAATRIAASMVPGPATESGYKAPRTPPPRAQERAVPEGDSESPRPSVKQHDRPMKSLVVSGVVFLGVGYFLSLVAAIVTTAIDTGASNQDGASCSTDDAALLVPLDSSGVQHGANCAAFHGPAVGFAVADEVLQLGGLGLIVTGLLLRRPAVSVPRVGSFELVPGTSATPVGLTLRFVEF